MKPHIKKKKGHSTWVCSLHPGDPMYHPLEIVGFGHTPAQAYLNWFNLQIATYI